MDKGRFMLYKQIFSLYYNLNLLLKWNKWKRKNIAVKFFFLTLICLGGFLFFEKNFLLDDIKLVSAKTFWTGVFWYAFYHIYNSLNMNYDKSDFGLMQITAQPFNAIIGYVSLKKGCRIIFPVIFSFICCYPNCKSALLFLQHFLFSFSLFNFLNLIPIIGILLQNINELFSRIFRLGGILLLICSFVLLRLTVSNPGISLNESLEYILSTLWFWIPFILYTISWLFINKVLNTYEFYYIHSDLTYQAISYSKLIKQKFSMENHEYQLWKRNFCIKGCALFILPNIVSCLLTIYVIPNTIFIREISIAELAFPFWLGIVGYSPLYIISKLNVSLNYLWVYRTNIISMYKFYLYKVIHYYVTYIISVGISMLIVYSVLMLWNVNYLKLLDSSFFIMIFLFPIVVIFASFCEVIIIKNSLNHSYLSLKGVIATIWLMLLCTFPNFYFLFISTNYTLMFLILIFQLVLFFLFFNNKIHKIEL